LLDCTAFQASITCKADPDLQGKCDGSDYSYIDSQTPGLQNRLSSNSLTCSGDLTHPEFTVAK
jgi:hypothetical protein